MSRPLFILCALIWGASGCSSPAASRPPRPVVAPKSAPVDLSAQRAARIIKASDDRLLAADAKEPAACMAAALSALQMAQEATRGAGLWGYDVYVRAGDRALASLGRCVARATLPERARAGKALREVIAQAPSPSQVLREEWSLQQQSDALAQGALQCHWDAAAPPGAARRAQVLQDLRGWRRQHMALLTNSASLAQDDQLEFVSVLLATDPLPCVPPDPSVWKLGAGLARQHALWGLLESFVAYNPHADDQLRDEVYNRQTVAIMKRVLPLDGRAVDVGTFKGELLKQMVAIAPAGHHLGFEPLPFLHASLKQRFANKRVTLHELALGEAPGTVTFTHVVDNPGYSGFEAPGANEQETRKIKVKVETLDRVLKGTPKVDFIKVDVEGAEIAVLKGAANTLCTQKPTVVFEFAGRTAMSQGDPVGELWQALAPCELDLYVLGDWLSQRAPLTRKAFERIVKEESEYYFVAAASKRSVTE